MYKYTTILLVAYLLITGSLNAYNNQISKAVEQGKLLERSQRRSKSISIADAQSKSYELKASSYGKMPIHEYAFNKLRDYINE